MRLNQRDREDLHPLFEHWRLVFVGRILVTGAAGFIGYHVADALLDQGHDVDGLDNVNDYYDPTLKRARLARLAGHDGFGFHEVDLVDRDAVDGVFRAGRYDAVVHLAAQAGVRYSLDHPHAYVDSNLTGFLNVLEGCRHHAVGHLLYASSSSVYGANTNQPFSTLRAVSHPLSLYAATKLANEGMAHAYSHLFDLPTTGLRFFTVYGPWGRPDMAMYKFVKAIDAGEPVLLFNRGDMERDFTFIDDAVHSVVELLAHPPEGDPDWTGEDPNPASSTAPYRVFNIGTHQPVRLLRVIEIIEELTGRPAERELLPMQPGDVPSTRADTTDLERVIGEVPATSIEDGIRRFYEWYRSYNAS